MATFPPVVIAGAVNVMDVAVLAVNEDDGTVLPPMVTLVAPVKFVPEIVTDVGTLTGLLAGLMPVITGALPSVTPLACRGQLKFRLTVAPLPLPPDVVAAVTVRVPAGEV